MNLIISYYHKILQMSRRTRIRHSSHRFQLGRIHHNRYSQSSTYFPESYSSFGSPIAMPTRFMPLFEKDVIHYVSLEGELFNSQCPLLSLKPEQLRSAKTANLTIAGRLTNKTRQSMPSLLYVAGMACCCLLALIDIDKFRRKFFARYSMTIQQYSALARVIQKLENCENLIINIQDNELTLQKMSLLTNAIAQSMGHEIISDSDVHGKRKRHVTIRNYCYYMKDLPVSNILSNLSQFEHLNAIFVWQKIVVHASRYGEKTETESLMMS